MTFSELNHSLFMCTFITPLSLLVYLYARSIAILWRRKCPGNNHSSRDTAMRSHNIKVSVEMCAYWTH